jgi:NAD(P)-dependent dehydrogenase (short-subunit alcohol dehydrogenase family)
MAGRREGFDVGRLEGKVAIVTGAGSGDAGLGSGIGQEIATTFAREGAAVVVVDRDEQRAENTVRGLDGLARRSVACIGDVTSAAHCARMVEVATSTFGGLDILVNKAAIARHAPLLETSEELYDETLAINLKGTFLACKHAVPALVERGGGSIVNIGSIVGIRDAGTGETAYAASKAGQLGITIDLAGAYGHDNVRVNAVLPGLIASPMMQQSSGGRNLDEIRSKLNLLGRFGEPADVAGAVLFLCSAEGSYLTGVVLPVDGGATVATPASTFRRRSSADA